MDSYLMLDGGSVLGWLGVVLVGLYGTSVLAASLIAPTILYSFGQEPFRHPAFEVRAVASSGLELPVAVHAGRPGAPAARFKADALVLFDAIPELTPEAGPVHVLGYSLGSGIALHVAVHRPVASVPFEAPNARLCDLMTKKPWAPACLIPWVPRWNSLALVPDIVAPIFIIHGIRDELILSSESLRLAEAFIANGRVVVTRFDAQADHWNVSFIPGLQTEMAAWIDDGGWAEAKGQSLNEGTSGFTVAGGQS